MHLASTVLRCPLVVLPWSNGTCRADAAAVRKGGQSANVSGRYGNFALCLVAALMIIELQQKDVAAACLSLAGLL